MRKLLIILVLLISSTAFAGSSVASKSRATELGTLLSAVAMNGAPSTRTFTIGPAIGRDELLGYNTLVLEVDYTHANNGTLTMTCITGATGATAKFSMTTCAMSSGTCTLNFSGVAATASLSADKDYSIRYGIQGYRALSCTIAHGGTPAAGDIVTVTGYLIAN